MLAPHQRGRTKHSVSNIHQLVRKSRQRCDPFQCCTSMRTIEDNESPNELDLQTKATDCIRRCSTIFSFYMYCIMRERLLLVLCLFNLYKESAVRAIHAVNSLFFIQSKGGPYAAPPTSDPRPYRLPLCWALSHLQIFSFDSTDRRYL